MRMVLIVGDNVGRSFQGSGLPNKETCTKISRSEMSRMWTHLSLETGPNMDLGQRYNKKTIRHA